MKKKVLILIDKKGWSYDTIAKGIKSYNSSNIFDIDIEEVKGENIKKVQSIHKNYDLIFPMGWQFLIGNNSGIKKLFSKYYEQLTFLDREKVITGIHSHRSWDDYLSLPEKLVLPNKSLIKELSKLKSINVISKRLYELFKTAGLNNIVLTENGVDHNLFHPTRDINTDNNQPLKVGFSGSTRTKKHDFLKGVTEFILPLQNLHNIQVEILGENTKNRVAREDMPKLYNQVDLYLCCSTSEGFSQSVLEAASCGRCVVTTKVGGCEDLIKEDYNGKFIIRDLEMIKSTLIDLEKDREKVRQMGENARVSVENSYTWEKQVKSWISWIEDNLAN